MNRMGIPLVMLALASAGCVGAYDAPERMTLHHGGAFTAATPGARVLSNGPDRPTCRRDVPDAVATPCPQLLPPGPWHVQYAPNESYFGGTVRVEVPRHPVDLHVDQPTRANRAITSGFVAAGAMVGTATLLILFGSLAKRPEQETTQNVLLAGGASLLGAGAATAGIVGALAFSVGPGGVRLVPRAP